LLGWLRNSPPAPLTRSVAATSVPFNFEIICWIGPPGAACTIKKLTTMIANSVGSISAIRRIAYAIIAAARQNNIVVPAKAGTHLSTASEADKWIPAFAGMTLQATSLGDLALF
jgi:hypothetical protein